MPIYLRITFNLFRDIKNTFHRASLLHFLLRYASLLMGTQCRTEMNAKKENKCHDNNQGVSWAFQRELSLSLLKHIIYYWNYLTVEKWTLFNDTVHQATYLYLGVLLLLLYWTWVLSGLQAEWAIAPKFKVIYGSFSHALRKTNGFGAAPKGEKRGNACCRNCYCTVCCWIPLFTPLLCCSNCSCYASICGICSCHTDSFTLEIKWSRIACW